MALSFAIPDLVGKVCLITGSSRGIGAAVARALGGCGSQVAVHYNTGKSEAEGVAADIARAGGKAILLAGDVATPGTATRLLDETVRQFGRLDILVNNAGDVIKRYPVAETPDELFDRQVAVNIRPVFEASRRAVLQFRSQGGGGTIINVELSRSADRGWRRLLALCKCKGLRRDVYPRPCQGGCKREHPGKCGFAGCHRHAHAGPHDARGASQSCTGRHSDGKIGSPRRLHRNVPLPLLSFAQRLRDRPDSRGERRHHHAVTMRHDGPGTCSTSSRRSGATSRSPPRAAPRPEKLRHARVGALERR